MGFYPGEGVKALRQMHDMSLERLSALTGIDVITLNEIEISQKNLSENNAKVLAKALKTFPDLLLSWNREN